jgi:hypothetical protein
LPSQPPGNLDLSGTERETTNKGVLRMSEQSGEILGAGSAAEPEPTGHEGPSHDAIARRAYEISQSDDAGTDDENWRRAEAELRDRPSASG